MGDPDVSVVVVHGTGTQERGHALVEWVESVLSFTRALGRRGAVTQVTELTEDGAEPVAGTVAVGAPGSGDDPVVTDPVVRLRIVEAHWAEAFTPPTPGDVLRWLLWFAPSLAVTQAVLEARAARAGGGVPEPGTATPGRVRLLRPLAPLYSIAIGLVGLALLGPLLLLATLVLVLSAAIPAERVRDTVAVVLTYLSQNVGDVQSFLIRPVARARMEARVAAVVSDEVRHRGREHVHVLATSQGAALAHAALLRLPRELRPARMTTVGGAHGRLHEIRTLEPPAWTRVPIVVTGLAWLLTVPVVGALGPVWGSVAVLGVTLLAGAALVASAVHELDAFAARAGRPAALPTPGVVPGVRWLDVWAPFDAVPNARPVAPAGPEYRYVVVPGQMQVLGDHLGYATDWTETVPRILHHVTGDLPPPARLGAPRGVRARAPLSDPAGEGPNWTPWAPRDWVAFALRVVPLVAALAVVLTPWRRHYAEVGQALGGVHRAARAVLDGATAALEQGLSLLGPTEVSAAGAVEVVVGLLVALALATAIGWVGTALFRVASLAEARQWACSLDHPPVSRWSTVRWLAVGAVIVLVWAALVVVAGAVLRTVD